MLKNLIAFANRAYLRVFCSMRGLPYEIMDDGKYALVYFPSGVKGNTLYNRKARDMASLRCQLRGYALLPNPGS